MMFHSAFLTHLRELMVARRYARLTIKSSLYWIRFDIYPNAFKMQVSVGVKNGLCKAFIDGNGYSLTKINNAALIIFKPIAEAFEQSHFVVAAIQ